MSPVDYSLDRIGERLDNPDLEPLLAADDVIRVQWILARSGGRVCEVGASDGGITKRLIAKGCRLFAIERHPAHREKLSALGCWTYFGDANIALEQAWPIVFDTVLLCEVLEHAEVWDDACRLARNALRVCRQGGQLLITVPNVESESYAEAERSRRSWPDHHLMFDDHDLRKLITQADESGRIVKVDIQPIVGTLHDSIWLGAVCWT